VPCCAAQGGIFQLRVTFSEQYPDRPPRVRFTSEVFHPNVSFVLVRSFQSTTGPRMQFDQGRAGVSATGGRASPSATALKSDGRPASVAVR
jgi:hypothetical protein